jgi:GAF domain-containing protein
MFDHGLKSIHKRLNRTLARNQLLQYVTNELRDELQVTRMVCYYFYRQWKGQVIIESLSHKRYSILGSTGADDCFNGEHADWYLAGRISRVEDVEQANFSPCHLEFLRSIEVRANLVVPVIVEDSLWGLLVAHHHQVRGWTDGETALMQRQAVELSRSPMLRHECSVRWEGN